MEHDKKTKLAKTVWDFFSASNPGLPIFSTVMTQLKGWTWNVSTSLHFDGGIYVSRGHMPTGGTHAHARVRAQSSTASVVSQDWCVRHTHVFSGFYVGKKCVCVRARPLGGG